MEPRDSSLGNSWRYIYIYNFFFLFDKVNKPLGRSHVVKPSWTCLAGGQTNVHQRIVWSHYTMLSKLWLLEFHLHQYLECLCSDSGSVAKLTVSGLTNRLANCFDHLKCWWQKKSWFPKVWSVDLVHGITNSTLTLLSQSITQYPGRYLSFSFKLKPQPTPIYSWNLLLHLS